MSEKTRGRYTEMRQLVERTASERLFRPFDEAYGVPLEDLEYSSSEIARARENFDFGKRVAGSFTRLLRTCHVATEEIFRTEHELVKNCPPAQAKKIHGVVRDLIEMVKETEAVGLSKIIAEAKNFLRERFGVSDNKDGIFIIATSFGAIKVRVNNEESWKKIVRRLGADEETAPLIGGCVASAPWYSPEEYAREHLKSVGRFIFINGKYQGESQRQVEDHETAHWFHNQVLVNYESPRYRNHEAGSFFLDVKNELVAYAAGESLNSSLSRLTGRDETGRQAFNRFVENLRSASEERHALDLLKKAGLLPESCREFLKASDLEQKLEEHRQLTGRGRIEIRLERQRIFREAYDLSVRIAKKAASELTICLREIARLDLWGKHRFDLIFPAVIGAQSFKELAFLLSEIDRSDAVFDAAQEFAGIDPKDLDLQRVDRVINGAVKWHIPVLNIEILVEKFRGRLDMERKELGSSPTLYQRMRLKDLEELLGFYEQNKIRN